MNDIAKEMPVNYKNYREMSVNCKYRQRNVCDRQITTEIF